jgi:hypothetical protein
VRSISSSGPATLRDVGAQHEIGHRRARQPDVVVLAVPADEQRGRRTARRGVGERVLDDLRLLVGRAQRRQQCRCGVPTGRQVVLGRRRDGSCSQTPRSRGAMVADRAVRPEADGSNASETRPCGRETLKEDQNPLQKAIEP